MGQALDENVILMWTRLMNLNNVKEPSCLIGTVNFGLCPTNLGHIIDNFIYQNLGQAYGPINLVYISNQR